MYKMISAKPYKSHRRVKYLSACQSKGKLKGQAMITHANEFITNNNKKIVRKFMLEFPNKTITRKDGSQGTYKYPVGSLRKLFDRQNKNNQNTSTTYVERYINGRKYRRYN